MEITYDMLVEHPSWLEEATSSEEINFYRTLLLYKRTDEARELRSILDKREQEIKQDLVEELMLCVEEAKTTKELDDLKNEFKHIHSKEYHAFRKQRYAELKQQEITKDRKDKIIRIIRACHHRLSHLHEYDQTIDLIQHHARNVSNDIHDLPVIWTGYESKLSLLKRESSLYKPRKEHFFPRQWAGEKIVRETLKHRPISLRLLFSMFFMFCHVHYVTKEENDRLRPFQRFDKFEFNDSNDWLKFASTSYQKAGIALIDCEESPDLAWVMAWEEIKKETSS